MAHSEDDDSLSYVTDDDDDLITIESSPGLQEPNARTRSILDRHLNELPPAPEMIAPNRLASLAAIDQHLDLIRNQRSERDNARRLLRAAQAHMTPTVIDLTDEPDSPVEERIPGVDSSRYTGRGRSLIGSRDQSLVQSQSQSQSQGTRNPRRTNSLRQTPPRLARSDSTFVGVPGVIDLTEDSPEDNRPPPPPPGLQLPALPPRFRHNSHRPPHRHPRHQHHHEHHHRHQHQPPLRPQDELIDLDLIEPRSFAGGLGRRLAGLFVPVISGFNVPRLDVSRNAFGAPPEVPKPPMEPIDPARSGFTRDTCAEPEEGSERVVVCPACGEELAYDPTGSSVAASGGSGTPRKRKRAPGEHHFWALKKCGHVYCADCFENRKPTKTKPEGVGFAGNSPNDIRCAVDGCPTKVILKGEWVGIFL